MTPPAADLSGASADALAVRRTARAGGAARRVAAAAALAAVLAAGGCSGSPDDAAPEIVVADSVLVGVLADLHILDARRALVADDTSGGDERAWAQTRDSVLTAAGYDAARVERELGALAARPHHLALTWASVQDSVDVRLRRLDTPAM